MTAAVVSIWPLALGAERLLPSGGGLLYLTAIGQSLMNQGFYHLPAAEGGVVLTRQVIIAGAWVILFLSSLRRNITCTRSMHLSGCDRTKPKVE